METCKIKWHFWQESVYDSIPMTSGFTYVSGPVTTTMVQINLKRKAFTCLTHSDHSSWWREDKAGTQGSNLETGTEEGCGQIFLPDLLPKAYIAYFLIQPMIICPSLALAIVGLVLLNQFLIKKMFKDMSICQCDGDSFSIYVPTFQLILDCVDKTNQQNQSIKQANKKTK